MLDPARLVFIDETAVSTNMVRLRGRIARGVRLVDSVPLGEWKTITFVAALRHNKMTAPMVIEGAMNGEMFLAYVEQCLVPPLKCNDIVVADNFAAHKVAGIQEAIEKAGATLRFLPSTRLTSTRSRCPTANSRNSCARLPRERFQLSTGLFARRTAAQRSGMRQLLQTCRLCFHMSGNSFSGARSGYSAGCGRNTTGFKPACTRCTWISSTEGSMAHFSSGCRLSGAPSRVVACARSSDTKSPTVLPRGGRETARSRAECPALIREARTTRKTPVAQFRCFELHLEGR